MYNRMIEGFYVLRCCPVLPIRVYIRPLETTIAMRGIFKVIHFVTLISEKRNNILLK
nr:MAG TPA: hypothetical protein [Caudoviricetes sp.]